MTIVLAKGGFSPILLCFIYSTTNQYRKGASEMALIECPDCSQMLSDEARRCPHCDKRITWSVIASAQGRDYRSIVQQVADGRTLNILPEMRTRAAWFLAANLAIAASIAILFGGGSDAFLVAGIVLLIGLSIPFVFLLMSKSRALRSHGVTLINPGNFRDEYEAELYELVQALSEKAGLTTVPDVGYYESDDWNAFATGPSRNNSLIAVSTELLNNLHADATAAVLGHEIAHIANGDMVTMTLIQSAINIIAGVLSAPFWGIAWFLHQMAQDSVGRVFSWIGTAAAWLITTIFFFLGNLVAKAFSRHREFKADRLASTLVSPEAMVNALTKLQNAPMVNPPREQAAFAALKVNTKPSFWELFSTHPSLERRIAALQEPNSSEYASTEE